LINSKPERNVLAFFVSKSPINIPEDVTIQFRESPPIDIEAEDDCSLIYLSIQIIEAELSGNGFPVVQRTLLET